MKRVLLSHPDILEAVIYEIPQIQDWHTPSSPRTRAYIVKAKGSNLTSQDVDQFLAQKAPEMKRLSGGVVFLDTIPKTTVSLELLVRHEPYRRSV